MTFYFMKSGNVGPSMREVTPRTSPGLAAGLEEIAALNFGIAQLRLN
jgi:hypothetical protein